MDFLKASAPSDGSDDEDLLRELAALDSGMKRNNMGKSKAVSKQKASEMDDINNDDFNDEDLLEELNELIAEDAGSSTSYAKPPPPKKPSPVKKQESREEHNEKLAEINEQRISFELMDPEVDDGDPDEEEEAELAGLITDKVDENEQKAMPMETSVEKAQPVPQRCSAGASFETKEPAGDVKSQVKAILIHRLEAFTKNGLAAQEDGDMKYAAECAENVKLFQEAIPMLDEVEIGMDDLVDVPKTPPPYRKIPKPSMDTAKRPGVSLTLEEELDARLAKYNIIVADFQAKGEAARARMNQRMADQIKQAIIRVKRGLPIQPQSLPVPPGFKDLPATISASPSTNSLAKPTPHSSVKPSPTASPIPPEPTPSAKSDKEILVEKQLRFKKAALLAKQKGDLPAASKYMQAARALEREIKELDQKAKANTSSDSQGLDMEFPAIVSGVSVSPASLLIPDLEKQLDYVVHMRSKFAVVKDAKHTQFYDQLIQKVKIDLHMCARMLRQHDAPLTFKVSQLNLPALEVNPGMPVDVLELRIHKIEKLKLPDGWKTTDAATFVAYEFPFPHENHQKGRTAVVGATDEPEFSDVFQLQINRKARQLHRILLRYPLKLSVYQKGGFLRSDKPCGEADVVLNALDEHATFGDTRDLLMGRRKTDGRITFEVIDGVVNLRGHNASAAWRQAYSQTKTSWKRRIVPADKSPRFEIYPLELQKILKNAKMDV